MELRYRSPAELVEALQKRVPAARVQCRKLLRQPLSKLLEPWIVQHGLERDRDTLVLNACHCAETYLRTRPVGTFDRMTWIAFRATALLHVAKVAFQPFGNSSASRAGPGTLPACQTYHSEIFFQPYERLGSHWFGGDWIGGASASDGSLWVLLADVTGHGYSAYLLACALPEVWQRCWSALTVLDPQPAHLLQLMHEMISDCLPEGVFLECALVRLQLDGTVTVGPAGGIRLLVKRGQSDRPDFHWLRGTWLGLRAPEFEDQRSWVLEHGDELLLATDGIFDQLEHSGKPESWETTGPLFETVRQLLERALQTTPQKDDLTMVLFRRTPPPSALPPPGQEGA